MAEKLVPFTTRLPGSLRKRIKVRASRDEVKVEDLMRRVIEAGLRAIDVPGKSNLDFLSVQPGQDAEVPR